MNLPEGLILIDKPAGITSFDVIRRLRKDLGVKKVGHAGTLDPMATGLMVIGVGGGTKLLKNYIGLDKTYEAEITLGIKTDTGDITGKVTEEDNSFSSVSTPEVEPPGLGEGRVREVLGGMLDDITLPVPIYSALKSGGEALYKKARRGEQVTPRPSVMTINSYKLLGKPQILEVLEAKRLVLGVEWSVGSGTYIRSLAEELGKRLGTVATLSALRRTKVGEFDVRDSRALGV